MTWKWINSKTFEITFYWQKLIITEVTWANLLKPNDIRMPQRPMVDDFPLNILIYLQYTSKTDSCKKQNYSLIYIHREEQTVQCKANQTSHVASYA